MTEICLLWTFIYDSHFASSSSYRVNKDFVFHLQLTLAQISIKYSSTQIFMMSQNFTVIVLLFLHFSVENRNHYMFPMANYFCCIYNSLIMNIFASAKSNTQFHFVKFETLKGSRCLLLCIFLEVSCQEMCPLYTICIKAVINMQINAQPLRTIAINSYKLAMSNFNHIHVFKFYIKFCV